MPRVISIHDYTMKPGITDEQFMLAVEEAQERRLFDLPGLEEYHFLRGMKGARVGQWTAVWIYSSLEDWEILWGSASHPKSKSEYPESWREWEDRLLEPLLTGHPDMIHFSAYEVTFSSVEEGH